MSAQLEFSGRRGRRALLSLLAAATVWMLVGATQANASSITVVPTVQGAGSVVRSGYDCTSGLLTNGGVFNGCGPTIVDSGFFGGAVSLVVTAVPRAASAANGQWEFVGWQGCPTPLGRDCLMQAGILQFLAFAPRAVFREVVDTARVSGPTGGQFTNSRTNTFGYSTALGATFECRLDGALASCGSRGSDGKATSTHTVPTDGTHNFVVTALSSRGNPSASPVTFTYIVDTVAPVAALGPATTVAEGAVTTLLTATFAFTSNEIGTFECRLDAAAFAPCTSPKAISDVPFGGRTFQVRSVDRAGNRSAAVSRSWTVTALDNDGDGFNQRSDCNDSDPAINPGRPEINDNDVDENCDGVKGVTPPPPPVDTGGSGGGGGGGGVAGAGAERILIAMPFAFSKSTKKFTVFTVLQVKAIPIGSTLKVTCAGPKGKKCPGGKSFTKTNAFGTVNLKQWLKKKLLAGTKITAVVTKPGNFIGASKTMTVQKKKRPSFSDKCIAPGTTKAVGC